MEEKDIKKAIEIIKNNGVVVMPTDTIYGVVGSAINRNVLEKIYKLRNRKKDKPMIILISSIKDLDLFNIKLTKSQKELLEKYWPNPLSVILNCRDQKFEYLHRGTKTLAFRLPKPKWLQGFLKKVGPLVAPSANLSSQKPSETIEMAKKYFGEKVDFYLDGGEVKSSSSTLIKMDNGDTQILRQGDFKIAW